MARSPLFDIFDPQGELQQDYELGLLPGQDEELDPIGILPIRRKRRPQIEDLLPEEEKQGMLRSLANVGASGLTGLGWLLDIPGSLVRGTISGVAEGDPLKGLRTAFSSSDERVSGRDLLRQFGMTGKDDTWGNFSAGLAAEIITDPLTFLNPGAMLGRGAYGTAGRAAERAGLLENAKLMARQQGKGIRQFLRENTPKSIIEMSDDPGALAKFSDAASAKGLDAEELLTSPLAGAMEFRVPGREAGTLIGGGALGDAAAKGLDYFGEEFLKKNRFTAPIANRATAFFDPAVMGEIDPSKQWRNREAFANATKNSRESMEWLAERQRAADKVTHNDFAFSSPRIQNAIRDTIEAKLDPARTGNLIDKEAVSALEAVPEWKQFRDDMAERLQSSRESARSMGLDIPVAQSLEDTGFFPAQAIWFNNPETVDLPDWVKRRPSPYSRGSRVLNTDDVVGRSRKAYTDLPQRSQTFRQLMAGEQGMQLRSRLLGANEQQVPGILDEAFAALDLDSPYSKVAAETVADDGHTIESLTDFLKDDSLLPSERKEWTSRLERLSKRQEEVNAAAKAQQDALKVELGDLLIRSDNQFAKRGVGLFDNSAVNDMARYLQGRAVSEANAPVVLDDLLANVIPMASDTVPGRGVKSLMDAATSLGFDPNALKEVLEKRGITNPEMLSVGDATIENLKRMAPAPQVRERGALGKAWDSYTNIFKVLSLANPAYHTRNLYSGFLSTLTGGGGNPFSNAIDSYAGWQAGKGNYKPLVDRLRDTPYARGLSDEEVVDKFLRESARNRLGSGFVFEGDTPIEQATKSLYPGGDTQRSIPFVGEGGLLYDPDRSWRDWLTVRGVDFGGVFGDRPPPSETMNPLIDLHERTARRVEDANRFGAYISKLREGYSPDAAANFVYKTQVDYSPRAFGAGERALKQVVPFYSYPRGIAPLVAENILYRPGGTMGQTTRAVSRASEPNEDFFLPENLRQSAAIPVPAGYPLIGLPEDSRLQRVVNNIDLPWEGLANLVTPGVGNTATQTAIDTVRKTGVNLLGQLNPLIKAPLEWFSNRQFYTGRDLSDAYSFLEKAVDAEYGPMARLAEQVLMNAPGGTKVGAIARTALDDRLTPAQKAIKLLVNNTLGIKATDYDPEQVQRRAARDMLYEFLSNTPGVRKYENITVPEEVLRAMEPEQKQQYLLYKVIQSEAAKRARDKKRAEQTALDPLELLGVVQNQ